MKISQRDSDMREEAIIMLARALKKLLDLQTDTEQRLAIWSRIADILRERLDKAPAQTAGAMAVLTEELRSRLAA